MWVVCSVAGRASREQVRDWLAGDASTRQCSLTTVNYALQRRCRRRRLFRCSRLGLLTDLGIPHYTVHPNSPWSCSSSYEGEQQSAGGRFTT